ncbi:MAG: hypothetical protein NTZ25_00900 [Candidatus Peregrinibacteria bacterium]|nr:hypothetical protein [Candidatus Peregrinibacteria bacterium]
MASEANKRHITEGESEEGASSSSLGKVGRTPKLLAALAFVMAACEPGANSADSTATDAMSYEVSGEVTAALSEESPLDHVQVMADKKGVQLFGNVEDADLPVPISLKLLGQGGEVLESRDEEIGPGSFNVKWNFSTTKGHKVEMTDASGKGFVYNLDTGATSIPKMPKQNN